MKKKIKQFDKTGVDECKDILKQLKKLDLDAETLYDTQLPRTFLWVYNKLKDIPESDPRTDFVKMVRFLYRKEWKPKFEVFLKKP